MEISAINFEQLSATVSSKEADTEMVTIRHKGSVHQVTKEQYEADLGFEKDASHAENRARLGAINAVMHNALRYETPENRQRIIAEKNKTMEDHLVKTHGRL